MAGSSGTEENNESHVKSFSVPGKIRTRPSQNICFLFEPISWASSCLTGTSNFPSLVWNALYKLPFVIYFFTYHVFDMGSAWHNTLNEGMETSTTKSIKTLKWSNNCNISAIYVEKWHSGAGQIRATLSESVVDVSIFFKVEKILKSFVDEFYIAARRSALRALIYQV